MGTYLHVVVGRIPKQMRNNNYQLPSGRFMLHSRYESNILSHKTPLESFQTVAVGVANFLFAPLTASIFCTFGIIQRSIVDTFLPA